MGVDNLWTLVAPKGRKLKLAALEGKVVAIDASMWMYQFARSMINPETGDPVPGAHVLGFFRRICKLLMLRIKPIFVFDGPPPRLKMETLRERRDETGSLQRRTKLLAAQIVKNALRGGRKPLVSQEPELISSASSSSSSSEADEIIDLEPSYDERTFRMSVPAAFRGFAAERRSLDEIHIAPSSSSPPKNRVTTQLDLEKVAALPGKDAYRELRKLQATLLQEGRDWAQGSQGSTVQDFSETQMKVFLQRSNVAEMISDSRRRMALEENLKPVSDELPVRPAKVKRRRGLDEELFKDPEIFASKLTRDELLFGRIEKKEEKMQVTKMEEEEDEVDVAALFGDGWQESAGVHPVVGMKIPRRPVVYEDEGEVISDSSDGEIHSASSSAPSPPSSPSPLCTAQAPSPVHLPSLPSPLHTAQAPSPVPSPGSPQSLDQNVALDESIILSDDSEELLSSDGEIESVSSVAHASPAPAPPAPAPPAQASPMQPTPPQPLFEINDDFEKLLESDLLDERNLETDDVWLEQELRRMALTGAEVDQTAFQEDIQELLAVFGVPWIRAPAEAEAQCCFLARHGLADAVISDDSDCLVFGTPVVLRHLYFGELTVQAFYQSSIGFTPTQLKMLAMLLGCDYTPGVYGIGIVNGAEIVKVYDGLDGLSMLHNWATRSLREDKGKETEPVHGEMDSAQLRAFKEQHKKLRLTWQFPHGFPSAAVWEAFTSPIVDASGDTFDWGTPVEDAIVYTLRKHTSLQETKIRELLSPTLRRYSETTVQRKITDFFSPVFDCGPVGEFASSRLKKAVQ